MHHFRELHYYTISSRTSHYSECVMQIRLNTTFMFRRRPCICTNSFPIHSQFPNSFPIHHQFIPNSSRIVSQYDNLPANHRGIFAKRYSSAHSGCSGMPEAAQAYTLARTLRFWWFASGYSYCGTIGGLDQLPSCTF